MKDERRLLKILGLVALGLVINVILAMSYVGNCGGQTGWHVLALCKPIRENPPWAMLSAIAAAPAVLYSWLLRWRHNDEQVRFNSEQVRNANEQMKLNAAQLRTAQESNTEQARVNAEQLRIAQEQQVAARFVSAVELLGDKDRRGVRIGGIYALGQIARDSAKERAAVVDTLCAFVRNSCPLKDEPDPYEEHFGPQKPGGDVEAALKILFLIGSTKEVPFDLSESEIMLTEFEGARLDYADFSDSQLFKSSFNRASLRHAVFNRAYLHETSFLNAYVDKTSFDGAHVRRADMRFSVMEDTEVDLQTLNDVEGAQFRPEHDPRSIETRDAGA